MPGRWLVDYWKKSAIYQPLTHYSTTCYTPTGRYGRSFALIKFCKHTLLETRHNYLCTSAKSVGEKFCYKFCEFCEFRGRAFCIIFLLNKQPMNDISNNTNHNAQLRITDWSEADRPREKLRDKGAETLSDAELLAILIGSGSTKESAVALMQRILSACDNNLNTLGKMSLHELMQYNGIGEAKAITIIAACELGKRRQAAKAAERPDMGSAQAVYEYMHPKMQDLDTEEAWVLLMNQRFRHQGGATVARRTHRDGCRRARHSARGAARQRHNAHANTQSSERQRASFWRRRPHHSQTEDRLRDNATLSHRPSHRDRRSLLQLRRRGQDLRFTHKDNCFYATAQNAGYIEAIVFSI